MKLKFKKLHSAAVTPKLATEGAACFDLHAILPDWATHGVELSNTNAVIFSTGLAFEVPEGFALMVYSRSGHGFKHGVRLANCVGVIDSDYRGEVCVKLTADEVGSLKVFQGARIAQAMLVAVPRVELVECSELAGTARGAGGFGSTGA